MLTQVQLFHVHAHIVERRVANRSSARQINGFQVLVSVKIHIPQRGHARHRHAAQRNHAAEVLPVAAKRSCRFGNIKHGYLRCAIEKSIVCRQSLGQVNFGHTRARLEHTRTISDIGRCRRIKAIHLSQTRAIRERIIADKRNRARNNQLASKAPITTFFECLRANGLQTLGERNRSDVCAIDKSAAANLRCSFGNRKRAADQGQRIHESMVSRFRQKIVRKCEIAAFRTVDGGQRHIVLQSRRL